MEKYPITRENTSLMQTAYFNRFSLDLPDELWKDCSHSGDCNEDCEFWAKRFKFPPEITDKMIRAELREYGAWNSKKLSDEFENKKRILWIASRDIREELKLP